MLFDKMPNSYIKRSSFGIYTAGFGTLQKSRLPDFIGPVPSVTLDKWYYSICEKIISYSFRKVKRFIQIQVKDHSVLHHNVFQSGDEDLLNSLLCRHSQ